MFNGYLCTNKCTVHASARARSHVRTYISIDRQKDQMCVRGIRVGERTDRRNVMEEEGEKRKRKKTRICVHRRCRQSQPEKRRRRFSVGATTDSSSLFFLFLFFSFLCRGPIYSVSRMLIHAPGGYIYGFYWLIVKLTIAPRQKKEGRR